MQAAATFRRAWPARQIALAMGLSVLTPAWAAPAAGRYDAEFCVSTSAAPPGCGPAQINLGADGRMRVRLHDFEYRLQINSSQVDVVLMHGTMQVDEFVATGEWRGSSLQFVDRRKSTRYEVRLGRRQAATR